MKPKRMSVVFLYGIVLATLTTACGGSSSSSGGSSSSSGSYLIGATGDFTGPLAGLGTNWRNGAQAYFTYINSHGGINGHKVNFVALDDASNATTGVANTKQLLADHETAEMVFFSNVILAATPLLDAAKTPAIVEAVTGSLLHPVNSEVFAGDAVISDEAYPALAFVRSKFSKPNLRVALLAPTSAVLTEFLQHAAAQTQSYGFKVVANEQLPLTATTAAAQAAAIAATHPDVVVEAVSGALAISADQSLRADGVTGPIVNYHVGGDYSTLQKLNDPNYYVLATTSYTTGPSATANGLHYLSATRAAKDDPSAGLLANGYLQAYVLGQALTKCGYPCSPQKATSALENIGTLNTHGLTYAPWHYSATNHNGISSVGVFHWDSETKAPVSASIPLPIPSN